MITPVDPLDEEMARACCVIDGIPPDQPVGVDSKPYWQMYLPWVRKFREMNRILDAHKGRIEAVASACVEDLRKVAAG